MKNTKINDVPTKEEVDVAINTITSIATFVAMRGLWVNEVTELVKCLDYLRSLHER